MENKEECESEGLGGGEGEGMWRRLMHVAKDGKDDGWCVDNNGERRKGSEVDEQQFTTDFWCGMSSTTFFQGTLNSVRIPNLSNKQNSPSARVMITLMSHFLN